MELEKDGAYIERVITREGVKHRADAYFACAKTVVEVQHSSISPEEIQERERFYGEVLWVFDVRDAYKNGRFLITDKGSYHTFRWKHPRKSAVYARNVYLDLGRGVGVFQVKKIHQKSPCHGWGHLGNYAEWFG